MDCSLVGVGRRLALSMALSLAFLLIGCGGGSSTPPAHLHAAHLQQIKARHLKTQAESTPALQKHAKLPRRDGLKGSASSMQANGRVVDVFDEWLVESAGTPAQVETRITYVVYSFLSDAVLSTGQVDPKGSVSTEVWRRAADTWCPIVSGLNFSTTATVRRTLNYDRTTGIAKLDFLVGTADGSLGEIAFVDNKPTSADCSINNVVPMYGSSFYTVVSPSATATPFSRLKLVDVNELTGVGDAYRVLPGLKYLFAWGPQSCPASYLDPQTGACIGGANFTSHAGLAAAKLTDGVAANSALFAGVLDPADTPYTSNFSIIDFDAVISIPNGGDPVNGARFQYAVSVASGSNNILGTKILTSTGGENPLGRQGYFDKSRWVSFGPGAATPIGLLNATSVVLMPAAGTVGMAYNFMQPYLANGPAGLNFVNSPGYLCSFPAGGSGCVALGESFIQQGSVTTAFGTVTFPYRAQPYSANTIFAPLQSFLPAGEAQEQQRKYVFYADTRELSPGNSWKPPYSYTPMFRPRLLSDTTSPLNAMQLPDGLVGAWLPPGQSSAQYVPQNTITVGQTEFFAAKDDQGNSRAYQIIRFDDTGFVDATDTSGKQLVKGGVMFCTSKLAASGSPLAIRGDKCVVPRPNAVGAEGFNVASALDILPGATYQASPSKVGYTLSPSGIVYINYISQNGAIATINASDPSQKWSAGDSAWTTLSNGRLAACQQTLKALPTPPSKKFGFWSSLLSVTLDVVFYTIVDTALEAVSGPFGPFVADILLGMGESLLDAQASATGDQSYLTIYGGSALVTNCKIS